MDIENFFWTDSDVFFETREGDEECEGRGRDERERERVCVCQDEMKVIALLDPRRIFPRWVCAHGIGIKFSGK